MHLPYHAPEERDGEYGDARLAEHDRPRIDSHPADVRRRHEHDEPEEHRAHDAHELLGEGRLPADAVEPPRDERDEEYEVVEEDEGSVPSDRIEGILEQRLEKIPQIVRREKAQIERGEVGNGEDRKP